MRPIAAIAFAVAARPLPNRQPDPFLMVIASKEALWNEPGFGIEKVV